MSWKLKIGLVPLFGESVVGGCRRGKRDRREDVCGESGVGREGECCFIA